MVWKNPLYQRHEEVLPLTVADSLTALVETDGQFVVGAIGGVALVASESPQTRHLEFPGREPKDR